MVIRKGGALLLAAILLNCRASLVRQRRCGISIKRHIRWGMSGLLVLFCLQRRTNWNRLLLFAVIRTESSFGPDAQSSVGARGLMQIAGGKLSRWIQFRMKDESGVSYDDLFDEKINIEYGTFLLKTLLDEFGSEANALCAYQCAGWGNAKKWLRERGICTGWRKSPEYPVWRHQPVCRKSDERPKIPMKSSMIFLLNNKKYHKEFCGIKRYIN